MRRQQWLPNSKRGKKENWRKRKVENLWTLKSKAKFIKNPPKKILSQETLDMIDCNDGKKRKLWAECVRRGLTTLFRPARLRSFAGTTKSRRTAPSLFDRPLPCSSLIKSDQIPAIWIYCTICFQVSAHLWPENIRSQLSDTHVHPHMPTPPSHPRRTTFSTPFPVVSFNSPAMSTVKWIQLDGWWILHLTHKVSACEGALTLDKLKLMATSSN